MVAVTVARRIGDAILLVVTVSMCWTTSFAAEERYSREQQFHIYASSVRHTPGFNKFAYFSEQMAATADAYRRNPRLFDTEYYNDLTGKWVKDQHSEEEVLANKGRRLRFELRPLDLEVAKIGVSLLPIPAWMVNLGDAAKKFLPEFNNKNPVLARSYQEAALKTAFARGQRGDALAQEINEAAREWIGVDTMQELSDSAPVKSVASFESLLAGQSSAAEREKVLLGLMSEANTGIKELLAAEKEQREAMDQAAAEATRRNKRLQETREIVGAMELVGYAAQLIGDKDLALAARAASFAFDRIATLSTAANMGALALTAGYVGVAIAICDMVSKAQAGDPVLMALSQVMSTLNDIRTEMHDRFDRVDQTLAQMWGDLASRLDELEQAGKRNHKETMQSIDSVRETLYGQQQQLSQMNFSLATSTRRLESMLDQQKRNDIRLRLEILARGNAATLRRELDVSLIALRTYVMNDLRTPPFADPLSGFQALSPEQKIAHFLDPISGGVDVVSGLQALSVATASEMNQPAPLPVANLVAWTELAEGYLRVLRTRGTSTPQLVSPDLISAILANGEAILERHASLFGDPANPSDARGKQLLLRTLAQYIDAQSKILGRIAALQGEYERTNLSGITMDGGLDDVLAQQRGLPPVQSGEINHCFHEPNCDWIGKNYVGNMCLPSPDLRKTCAPVAVATRTS